MGTDEGNSQRNHKRETNQTQRPVGDRQREGENPRERNRDPGETENPIRDQKGETGNPGSQQ